MICHYAILDMPNRAHGHYNLEIGIMRQQQFKGVLPLSNDSVFTKSEFFKLMVWDFMAIGHDSPGCFMLVRISGSEGD